MTNKHDHALSSIRQRPVAAAVLAAGLAFLPAVALHAEEGTSGAPAKVEAAPELAPGIAPGVVPGAHPGSAEPQPGIAPGVTPGARAGGMEPSGPSAGADHPAFAPAPADNAAIKYSTTDVLGSPDWPCVQRKVLTISPAQVWDGPQIDDIKEFSPDVRDLTDVLESRRISLDDADKAIQEFTAKQPEAERDKRLTELFASVIGKMNTDRQFVIGKVEEFQRRQKARAAELEREGQKLAEKGMAATEELLPTETTLSPEQQEYNWNARIFQERQQNLTMACEVPVLIEQRLYEVAKLIRSHMKS